MRKKRINDISIKNILFSLYLPYFVVKIHPTKSRRAFKKSTSFLDVEMFGKTFFIKFRKLNFDFIPVRNRFFPFFF